MLLYLIEEETTSNLPITQDITTTEISSTPDITTTEITSTSDITTTEIPSTPHITTTEIPSTPDITTTEIHSTPDITTTEISSTPDITTSDIPIIEDITLSVTMKTDDTSSATSTSDTPRISRMLGIMTQRNTTTSLSTASKEMTQNESSESISVSTTKRIVQSQSGESVEAADMMHLTTGSSITEVDPTVTVESDITSMNDLNSNSEDPKVGFITSVGITKCSTVRVSGGINDLTTTETDTRITPECRVETEQAIVENAGKETGINEKLDCLTDWQD